MSLTAIWRKSIPFLVLGGVLIWSSSLLAATNVVRYDVYTDSTWTSTIYYRCDLDAGGKTGTIRFTAVDDYTLYIKGEKKGQTGSKDDDWQTMESYTIESSDYDGDILQIAVVVNNSGLGVGNGLIMYGELGGQPFYTSLERRFSPWRYSVKEPDDDSWRTADLRNRDPATREVVLIDWQYVQNGTIEAQFIIGVEHPECISITGNSNFIDVGGTVGGGLSLSPLAGYNLAEHAPTGTATILGAQFVVDGNMNSPSYFIPLGADQGINKLFYISWEFAYAVNRVSIHPRGDNLDEWKEYQVRGFIVNTYGAERGRIEEVASVDHGRSEDEFEHVSLKFDAERSNYCQVQVHQVRETKYAVAEIMVYAEGYPYEAEYTSPVLNLGSNQRKVFGRYRWDVDLPTFTSIAVQFRSGSMKLSEAETSEDSLRSIENVEWSDYQSLYKNTVKGNDWGIDIPVAEPNAYLQYRVRLRSTEPSNTPTLHKLTFESSDSMMPVGAADARVWPVEVYMKMDTSFTYTINYQLHSNNEGIKDIVLLMPNVVQFDTILASSRVDLPSYTVRSTIDSLIISFSEPITSNVSTTPLPVDTLSIKFDTFILVNSYDMKAFIVAPDSAGAIITVEEKWGYDPILMKDYSRTVYTMDVMSAVLSDVRANPRVISPNGDNVCDYTVIEFELAVVNTARIQIEIFDSEGRKVRELLDKYVDPSPYVHPGPVIGNIREPVDRSKYPGFWDGTDDDGYLLLPGIYMYRLYVDIEEEDKVEWGTIILAY